MQWNTRLFFIINRLAGKNRFLDAFARAGAEWVLPAMIGWFAVAVFARYDGDVARMIVVVLTLALTAGFGLILSYGIAAIVREPRPYVRFPSEVKTLFKPLLSWKSFPSDHSLAVFLLIGVAYCFALPWVVPLIIMGTWVVFGRVYAGVHYPSDILAGLTLGALVLLVYGMIGLPLVRDAAPALLALARGY